MENARQDGGRPLAHDLVHCHDRSEFVQIRGQIFLYRAALKTSAFMFWMMKSANWLVLTFVAPGIKRSKSYVTFF